MRTSTSNKTKEYLRSVIKAAIGDNEILSTNTADLENLLKNETCLGLYAARIDLYVGGLLREYLDGKAEERDPPPQSTRWGR
jgi:hypothetical protein